MQYTLSMRLLSGKSASLLFLAVLLSGTAWFVYGHLQPTIVYKAPPTPKEDPLTSQGAAIEETESQASSSVASALPPRVVIQVPFASQAPLGDWGMPYQEACEESSLILVHHYLTGEAMSPEIMDAEIRKMADYEVNELGFHADTTAEKNAEKATNTRNKSSTTPSTTGRAQKKTSGTGGRRSWWLLGEFILQTVLRVDRVHHLQFFGHGFRD